jgi:hypothetical protein
MLDKEDKNIDIHSEYVIFIAFSRQQWLRERASISHYSALPVLLESVYTVTLATRLASLSH